MQNSLNFNFLKFPEDPCFCVAYSHTLAGYWSPKLKKIWNDPQKTLKKNASGKKMHLLKTNKTTGNSLVPKYIILIQIHDHNVGTLNYPRHPYIFKAPLKLIQPSSYTILDENAHINSGQSTTFSINPVICNRERCIEYWACVSSGICLPIVRCCSVSVSN